MRDCSRATELGYTPDESGKSTKGYISRLDG